MSFKRLYYLLSILLIATFTTCRTAMQPPSLKQPEIKISYPVSHIELPTVNFQFYMPKISLANIEEPLPYIDITENFCSHDINHVASKDPKLFANGDRLVIDLLQLRKYDYSFPLPGAKLISPYAGKRKHHSGIDLKTCANDTIRAVFDGIVRMAKAYAAYGNVIVIRHFNGLETVYSHNSNHLIKQGDRVKAGQPIALVGRTGRATTDHLHFETRVNGQHFNPELLFDINTQQLQEKSLYCIHTNNHIKVSAVDPFPYQLYIPLNASN